MTKELILKSDTFEKVVKIAEQKGVSPLEIILDAVSKEASR